MSLPDYFAVFGGHRRLGAAAAEPECLLVPLSDAIAGHI
jgi:hypothetical protein